MEIENSTLPQVPVTAPLSVPRSNETIENSTDKNLFTVPQAEDAKPVGEKNTTQSRRSIPAVDYPEIGSDEDEDATDEDNNDSTKYDDDTMSRVTIVDNLMNSIILDTKQTRTAEFCIKFQIDKNKKNKVVKQKLVLFQDEFSRLRKLSDKISEICWMGIYTTLKGSKTDHENEQTTRTMQSLKNRADHHSQTLGTMHQELIAMGFDGFGEIDFTC